MTIIFFSAKSNNEIFKLQQKSFTIIDEFEKNKTFLIWIKEIDNPISFNKASSEYDKYYYTSVINLKNNIYSSYDQYINQKYEVEINHQTLKRLKNYFR